MTTKERLGAAQPVDAVGDDFERVDVEAGIGFVEHGEPRLEQRHLQNLVALLFAAGKADIDRAAQHVLVDAELAGGVAHLLDEFRRGQFRLAALLALRIERGAQERHGGDTGNFQRILEGEKQTGGRAFVGRHVENILAVEQHLARRRRRSRPCRRAHRPSVDLPEPFGPMIACTSPAFTVRSRPLRISLPSISTCRFLTSRSAIPKTPKSVRLAIAPTPAPFAVGLAPADDRENGQGDGVEARAAPPAPNSLFPSGANTAKPPASPHGPNGHAPNPAR